MNKDLKQAPNEWNENALKIKGSIIISSKPQGNVRKLNLAEYNQIAGTFKIGRGI